MMLKTSCTAADVYDEDRKHNLELPLFYGNMEKVFAEL